MNDHLAHELII